MALIYKVQVFAGGNHGTYCTAPILYHSNFNRTLNRMTFDGLHLSPLLVRRNSVDKFHKSMLLLYNGTDISLRNLQGEAQSNCTAPIWYHRKSHFVPSQFGPNTQKNGIN
ncbi:hypothetical protein CEXT_250281 [Caerostris extrusa]|uniref:Uncharacterized protein n=1 Tax=Caerostris extrusa TaxID=172846 RepID=A0AAV4RLL9_CAEEX|nr:hypothetical protein CEXT_250281 [Caerostris extrusa]